MEAPPLKHLQLPTDTPPTVPGPHNVPLSFSAYAANQPSCAKRLRGSTAADYREKLTFIRQSPKDSSDCVSNPQRFSTMFGAFRITNPLSSGLLWKIPWRLSKFQKRRHRLRLRAVDNVVATVDAALAKKGQTLEALERWKAEMPTEAEMLPKDKYTMFDRKAKRYRKGIHKLPKWTRVSQRINPPGY
ncbi:hypothetical protein FNYG_04912 [Fusarium nygamai]|uniref:54S ribosomal protein L31, mitochondrial n=20 Tax=Fusarium TaxID=5506 RepID=A0A2K0WHY6_GIBNY|nr:hypothetical protein FNYG_04912 [Fusarium nygamai]